MNFGLIAELENTRVSLPLSHVEARFRVTGDLASVEMDQVFEQNARQALNVTYTFPLPGQASVFRCEMHVNGRVIRAVVMEEKAARRFVQQKIAAGHRTALVEFNRDNVFTLELGNVAPGDRIVIRFAYLQPLERLGDQLSLRLPFNLGVRYISGRPLLRSNRGSGVCDDTDQVPDASLISPPRIPADHPDAATLYVRGDFDAEEVKAGSLISPSHAVRIDVIKDRVEVELAGEELVPDSDLVLRWQEPTVNQARPMAWSCRHESWHYGLVQLRAPQQVAADERPQDIYFLLDRSGSMEGENWQQCTKALHAFVHELGARDRVWITCFESSHQDFSDSPMLRDELLADSSFQNFEQIGTGGGTELLPALEHMLQIRASHSLELPSRLILITDGQVGNEPEILRLMRGSQAAKLPVHTFGIDRCVNDAFLQQMAAQSGGRCTLMTPQDDIPAAVGKLGATLRRPVLTHLQLAADVEVPALGQSLNLPDLHAGEVLLLPVRVQGSGRVQVTARQPDCSPWSMEWDLESAPSSETARLAWVKSRIKNLQQAERDAEAVELAIHHNLVCDGASFVAWDEAAKTAVSKIEVVQPSIDSLEFGNIADPDDRDSYSAPMRRMAKVQSYISSPIRYRVVGSGCGGSSSEVLLQQVNEPMNWAPWQAAFEEIMKQKMHVPQNLVRQLIMALHAWAGKILGQQRHKTIESWVTTLEASNCSEDEFLKMLEPVSDEAVQHARFNIETWKRSPEGWLIVRESNQSLCSIVNSPNHPGDRLQVCLPQGVLIPLCSIPAGIFIMGSPEDEEDRFERENQVEVMLSKPFWMAKTPLTQAQWEAVMDSNPSSFKGPNLPVENVNWKEAQAYVTKLNEKVGLPEGWKFDLPTEAQWEYACRAGEKGPYSGGSLDEVGWYDGRGGRQTHAVGQKRANAWGLHDMHGNVFEWCADWVDYTLKGGVNPTGPASGRFRMFRGGSWGSAASFCRAAFRFWSNPGRRNHYLGFRLVLVPFNLSEVVHSE